MRNLTWRRLLAAFAMVTLVLAGSACSLGSDDGSKSDSKTRDTTNVNLQKDQPAHEMSYSPTRETINFWIDTWGKPGKLSFIYLQGASGDLIGYYVFKGLPVSYCAALTPTYKEGHVDSGDGDSNDQGVMVPAPSMDGVYYSGGGGLCNTYYGKDATTGSYMEYTVGYGQNVLLYDAPLPRQDVQPLGRTVVKDGKPVKGR